MSISQSLEQVDTNFFGLAVVFQHVQQKGNNARVAKSLEVHQNVEFEERGRRGAALERLNEPLDLVHVELLRPRLANDIPSRLESRVRRRPLGHPGHALEELTDAR